MIAEILQCPVCGSSLYFRENAYQCTNAHSFDLSKEGYLNLLLNAKSKSGDSKQMMTARQDFLSKGYYNPLSDQVNQLLIDSLPTNASVLDIGTGVGYYLSRFQAECGGTSSLYGLDISKLGIKLAAKQNKNIFWLVANFAHLPFADHSLTTLLAMFAEYSAPEICRVLADKGHVIIVRAGEDHLKELKALIYPEIHKKSHVAEIKDFPGYIAHKSSLTYRTLIKSQEDLQNLLQMTPHYWKIKPESAQRLKQFQQLEVSISAEITVLSS